MLLSDVQALAPRLFIDVTGEENLLTLEEICQYRGISRRSLQREIAQGRFPKSLKEGRSKLWSKRVVDAWIDGQIEGRVEGRQESAFSKTP